MGIRDAKKVHYLMLRVKFDKPLPEYHASKLALQVLQNEYYPHDIYGYSVEEMTVENVRPPRTP